MIEDKLAGPDGYMTEGELAGSNEHVIKNAEVVKNFGQLMMKRAPKKGIKVAQAARVELSNDQRRPPGGQVLQGGDRPPPQAAQQGQHLQMERQERDQLPGVTEEDELEDIPCTTQSEAEEAPGNGRLTVRLDLFISLKKSKSL